MGKKVIPEQVTVFCDRCNKEGINIDLKIRAEKTHDFWESPGGNFLSPGSPKIDTNQQDNLQKNNKKKTTYSR